MRKQRQETSLEQGDACCDYELDESKFWPFVHRITAYGIGRHNKKVYPIFREPFYERKNARLVFRLMPDRILLFVISERGAHMIILRLKDIHTKGGVVLKNPEDIMRFVAS